MATSDSGTTFGATVIPTPERPSKPKTLPPPTVTTLRPPTLTPTVSYTSSMQETTEEQPDGDRKAVSPFSCFYQHPPASFERVHSRANSKTNLGGVITEKDLESGAITPLSTNANHDDNMIAPNLATAATYSEDDDKMWPTRQTLMMERQAEKRKRRGNTCCAPVRNRWSALGKRQKLWFKIALALFVVGTAVGVAVGISVAVHGGYYASQGNSNQIGQK